MPYSLTSREIEAVSGLPPQERFAHFVKRVADWEEVWGLRNAEGWVLSQSASGQIAAPFWPHAGYAENCAQGAWANCEPTAIPLDKFIEKWLPGLAKDHRLVEVFPTANQPGQPVFPTELLEAITAECREAYGDDI